MSTRILTITLLLLSVCLCAHLSNGNLRHPFNSRPKKVTFICCPDVTSDDISKDIIGENYEKLKAKEGCVEAIILRKSDGKICADPKAEWVKKLIANMKPGKP